MATSSTRSVFPEPEPRRGAYGTAIRNRLFIYRGFQQSFRGLSFRDLPQTFPVETFNADTTKWTQVSTTGPNPPGLQSAAFTSIGNNLLSYGGWTGQSFTDSLSELDTTTMQWRQLQPLNPSEGPMKKRDAGMIALSSNLLCVIGGYGIPSGTIHQASKFIKDSRYSDGRGWTNEVHVYNTETRLWSVPHTTGECPPPCRGFTFTRVDRKRGVMFGGWQPGVGRRVADTYTLNFKTWHWSRLPRTRSQPWPVGRNYHTAFSLYDPDSNPPHPCLAVTGGADGDLNPLQDMWICNIDEGYWEKVFLSGSFPARWNHTTEAIHKNQTHVRSVSFGGCPDNPNKYTSPRDRPLMAQTTIVDLEMDESKSHPGRSTGWVATRVLDSAALASLVELAAQSVYEVALREGMVKYRSILSILSGAAGSGKSTLKRLLFGMIPPVLRQSTPLAEAPVRAISYVRVDATDVEWHVIDDEGQDRLIAGEMAAGVPPDDTPLSEPTPQPVSDESPTTDSSPSTDTPEVSTTTPSAHAAPEGLATSESCPIDPPSDLPTSQPNQANQLPSSLARPTHMVQDKLVSLIATKSFQQGMGRKAVDMIYLLDCGGQPQFQSILPLLLGEPTTMMFLTKLSERLDHHPQIAFYEKGKPLSQPYPSLLSHEEILKCSVQALQSRVHAEGESQSTTPSLLVVGSHRDREWRCSETRADKNKRLISLLSPVLQKHLVFYGDDLIFPVNAKNPGKEDRNVASELRKAILKAASSLEPEEIPLGWYVLDIALHRLASFLGRGILTQQECLQVAHKLHITGEGFEAALDYLSRLNMILYFRSVLPNLVFCSPQVLLDKLTELVRYNYQLRTTRGAITDRMLMFRDKGLVTLEFLQEFPKHYDPNLFTPTDLLQLLEHRLIIAQVEEGMYFMPFILPDLPPDQVDCHRVQPSLPAAALVVLFPGGVAPTGSFSALVASLLSTQHRPHWELLPSSTNPGRPECVFRNCIKFKLPNGAPGSLTLIDSFAYIEAHVDAPTQVVSSLCPQIRENIFQHLLMAASALQYKNLQLEAAFLCESEVPHSQLPKMPPPLSWWERLIGVEERTPQPVVTIHPATMSEVSGTRWWRCTLSPDRAYGELQERHLIWMEATTGEVAGGSGAIEGTTEDAISTRVGGECCNTANGLTLGHHDQTTSTSMPDAIADPCPSVDDIFVENPPASSTTGTQSVDKDSTGGDRPTMMELIRFRGRERRINIPQEISTKCHQFAVLLLEDSTGARIRSMEQKHSNSPEDINVNILEQWIEGKGRKPVTWRTLVEVLYDVQLISLADDIAAVKFPDA